MYYKIHTGELDESRYKLNLDFSVTLFGNCSKGVLPKFCGVRLPIIEFICNYIVDFLPI